MAGAIQSMVNRRVLGTAVVVMSAIGVIGLLGVLARSWSPSERARTHRAQRLDLRDVAPGTLRPFPTRYGTILVYRPSPESWSELGLEGVAASSPRLARFNKDIGMFIYRDTSTRKGSCSVRHLPPGTALMNWTPKPWRGGFQDPCWGTVFDYTGHPLYGSSQARRLQPVPVRRVDDLIVEVALDDDNPEALRDAAEP